MHLLCLRLQLSCGYHSLHVVGIVFFGFHCVNILRSIPNVKDVLWPASCRLHQEEQERAFSLKEPLYAIDPVDVEAQHVQRLNGAFVINLGIIPADGVIVVRNYSYGKRRS